MNQERIQELVKQAENYAAEQNDKFGVSYKKEYNQKFAELIVRECCVVILTDPWLGDVRSATRGCARSIKEHFGVEE